MIGLGKYIIDLFTSKLLQFTERGIVCRPLELLSNIESIRLRVGHGSKTGVRVKVSIVS